MNFDEYQKINAINASFLKACLKSAYDGYKYLHEPKPPTDAMDFGSAVDCKLLEPELFDSKFCVVPNDAPKKLTKAQQEAFDKFPLLEKPTKAQIEANERSTKTLAWWDGFEKANNKKILLDAKDIEKINRVIQNCNSIEIVKDAIANFEKQKTITAEVNGLTFKGRLDLLGADSVIDVKTTRSANIREFTRQVVDLAYDVQLLHYCMMTNSVNAFIIAIESDTCEVACFNLNDIVFSDFTKARHTRALEVAKYVLTLSECPKKFKPEIVNLTLPKWAAEEAV